MKQIQQEHTTYTTVYEAYDGKTFDSPEECKKYESTAYAVLEKDFLALVAYKNNEYSIFSAGSSEYNYFFIQVTSPEVISIIAKILEYHNLYSNKARQGLQEALAARDYVALGNDGYDPEYYWLGTLTNMRKNIIDNLNIDNYVNNKQCEGV